MPNSKQNYIRILTLNQNGSAAVYYDTVKKIMKVLDTKTYKEKNRSYPLI